MLFLIKYTNLKFNQRYFIRKKAVQNELLFSLYCGFLIYTNTRGSGVVGFYITEKEENLFCENSQRINSAFEIFIGKVTVNEGFERQIVFVMHKQIVFGSG